MSPIATCPAHFTLLDMKTLLISVKECKLLRSSLCNFLHFHLASFLLDPNILSSALFSTFLHVLLRNMILKIFKY
jgi:hypothetical protein